MQVDLASPLELDDPIKYAPTASSSLIKRPPQNSLFPYIPPHIISSIASNLLLPTCSTPTPQKPAKYLSDLLSLCRSSSTFRQLHLPETTWAELVTLSVDQFRTEQCDRWRANPTGSGGIAPVWISLDNAFISPVQDALKRAETERSLLKASAGSAFDSEPDVNRGGSESGGDNETVLSARDVLYWWLYSDVWRSRRRVWHSVIYACAEARNADWW